MEPVLHPSLGYRNHTMLFDKSCSDIWYESKSWTSVIMHDPSDESCVSFFVPVDNVFDTPYPIHFGKDTAWHGAAVW